MDKLGALDVLSEMRDKKQKEWEHEGMIAKGEGRGTEREGRSYVRG